MPIPLLLPLLALAPAQEGAAGSLPTVRLEADGLVLDRSARLLLPPHPVVDADGDGVVRIVAEGVTVECVGELRGESAQVAPDAFEGVGVRVEAPGVTLRGARVSGFRVGIHVVGADGATLEDCDVSGNFRQRLGSTVEREDPDDWLWPHANDDGEWLDRYGAGIGIEDSTRVTVRRCRARDGQNGLVLDRCAECLVYDNDFSFLSGWGLAMWRSSRNFVTRNALDFCIRGYSHGVYNRGQDSAGLLMFEQCSSNVIAENSITHGGDAVFAFSGREALGEGVDGDDGLDRERLGNADNSFAGNDLSFAAAHGLELTFGFGNRVFENRFVENAICGVWGGYSRDTLVAENLFVGNGDAGYGLERGGVNVEHGQRNVLLRNRFVENACGVHLWWDPDPHLADLPWTVANGFGSGDNLLIGNEFEGDTVAVQLRAAGPTTLADNRMVGVGAELLLENTPEPARLAGLDVGWERPDFPVFGESRPVGAREELRGREHVVMTEWGPYDWERPLVVRRPAPPGAHRWELLGAALAGASATPRPAAGTPSLVVEVEEQLVTVRPDGTGVVPYELEIATRAAGTLEGSATLVAARWDVTFFAWETDPREDAEAWRAESASGVPCRLDEIDFAFGSGGPSSLEALSLSKAAERLPADRFGTLARTELALPAGAWTLRTASDDGVRLWLDDELVIDDWTWHATRAAEAAIVLDEPRAVRLRLEHFELDGAARLAFTVEPRP